MLQLGNILERVEWNNSVIMVSCECHHGWILLLFGCMQRTILDEVVKAAFFLTATEVRAPEMADGELMESKHICDRYLIDYARE
jgi:hypothetical protein